MRATQSSRGISESFESLGGFVRSAGSSVGGQTEVSPDF
jgi:hypothetical protein